MNIRSTFWSLAPNSKTGRFMLYHFPAFAYAALIYYVSSLQFVQPPSLGFSWEDKIYHFGEYAVLTIFIFIALKYYKSKFIRKHIYLITGLITSIFAVTDEIHQYYVPGRESTLGDLIADCIGAIGALIVIRGFFRVINSKRH